MLIESLTTIIFPTICVACRKRTPRGAICESCFSSISVNETLIRGECRANFPFILGGATSYDNPAVAALIHNLKFRFVKSAAEPLGALLYQYILNIGLDLEEFVIIPIPLSRRRFRERGFNQAELIARACLAREIVQRENHECGENRDDGDSKFPKQLEIANDLLVRSKHTKRQSDLETPAERSENIRGAFAVADGKGISGRSILLIDDVSTSGSTFLEASVALKSAGAKKIIAIAVAKT